jgi:hypothetical protein
MVQVFLYKNPKFLKTLKLVKNNLQCHYIFSLEHFEFVRVL